MRKCLRVAALLALMLTFCKAGVQAQSLPDSLLVKAFATDELLPRLIDSAIQNSAEIKRAGSAVQAADMNLQMNKRAVYNAFSLSGGVGYGTNVTGVSDATSLGISSNLTTAQVGSYHVAFGVVLPLTQLLNRKNVIRSGQLQKDMAEAEKENTALGIKQEVIRLYQALKLSQRLMAVNSKNRQIAQINYNMAEKNFVQGQISLEQLSMITETYNKAAVDFETSVNAFQTNYMYLETFTGVNLSRLISQAK